MVHGALINALWLNEYDPGLGHKTYKRVWADFEPGLFVQEVFEATYFNDLWFSFIANYIRLCFRKTIETSPFIQPDCNRAKKQIAYVIIFFGINTTNQDFILFSTAYLRIPFYFHFEVSHEIFYSTALVDARSSVRLTLWGPNFNMSAGQNSIVEPAKHNTKRIHSESSTMANSKREHHKQ